VRERRMEKDTAPRGRAPHAPALGGSLRRAAPARSRSALAPAWHAGSKAGARTATAAPAATDGALALLEQIDAALVPEVQPAPAHYHILIVEDDARMVGMIRAGIELEGESDWEVQAANGGLRALELALAAPPDVVLLDVRLPDLDGAEVYHHLRTAQQTRAARILFLTAGTSYDLCQRGIDDGVLLRKPFDVRELVSLVRALLDG
jgi:CheY-like chemotaxis protein